VEFPAYWIVCPLRHTNRRPVSLFTDWIRAEGTKFDQAARQLLKNLGCTFRMAREEEPGRL
jgi:LysR family transcriptional regulator, glycine cleavage system transcriptional activator